MEKLKQAILLEISLMGDFADKKFKSFHSAKNLLEMAIESLSFKNSHLRDVLHYINAARFSFYGVNGTLEYQMRLIELSWRVEKEFKFYK